MQNLDTLKKLITSHLLPLDSGFGTSTLEPGEVDAAT